MNMELHSPFAISARLLPALRLSDGAWISLEGTTFYLDLPDGSEHTIADVRPPRGLRFNWQRHFATLLSFLGACAESRQYRARNGSGGENVVLFSEPIGAWAERMSDELAILAYDIDNPESETV